MRREPSKTLLPSCCKDTIAGFILSSSLEDDDNLQWHCNRNGSLFGTLFPEVETNGFIITYKLMQMNKRDMDMFLFTWNGKWEERFVEETEAVLMVREEEELHWHSFKNWVIGIFSYLVMKEEKITWSISSTYLKGSSVPGNFFFLC